MSCPTAHDGGDEPAAASTLWTSNPSREPSTTLRLGVAFRQKDALKASQIVGNGFSTKLTSLDLLAHQFVANTRIFGLFNSGIDLSNFFGICPRH